MANAKDSAETIARRKYDRIIRRARDDDAFLEELRADPRRILERELGIELPEGLLVRVDEAVGSPAIVTAWAPEAELTEAELHGMAAGISLAEQTADQRTNALMSILVQAVKTQQENLGIYNKGML